MNPNPFDHIIKQKAEAHEAPVPTDAWDNIIKNKRKKPRPFIWWSLSSLLIITGFFVYLTHTNEGTADAKQIVSDNNTMEQKNVPITESKTQSKNFLPTTRNNSKISNITVSADLIKKDANTVIENNNGQNIVKKQNPTYANNSTLNSNTQTASNRSSLKNHQKHNFNQKGSVKYSTQTPDIVDEENNDRQDGIAITEENNKDKLIATNASPLKNETENPGPSQSTGTGFLDKDATDSPINEKKTAAEKNTIIKKENKKQSTPNFTVDFSLTPVFPIQAYNDNVSLKRITTTSNTTSDYTATNISSDVESSLAFSLAVTKRINSKLRIGTGIQFLSLDEKITLSGEETNTTYTEVERLVYNNNGPVLIKDTLETITTGTRKITALNNYKTYSIPLYIQFSLMKKRNMLIDFNTGMYFNIVTTYTNNINGTFEALNDSTLLKPASKTSTGTDIFGGIRLSGALRKNWWLFAEPSMRFNLANYDVKNSLVPKKIHQAGIAFGISYHFK